MLPNSRIHDPSHRKTKMKIFIKTLKGNHFGIEVSPEDTVADVKKNIEAVQGSGAYSAFRQMLIYQGKVLMDDTTLKENKVAENSFILIMLTESTSSAGEGDLPTHSSKPSSKTTCPTPTTAAPQASIAVIVPPDPAPAAASSTGSAPASMINAASEAGVASNQVTGSNFEETVQQIIDIGGGAWNRETVIRALGAALNDPELAVEYLYSGHPYVGPNASGGGYLGFLRNSRQFQALRAMVQADPETLQPMVREFRKQNPNLMRLIEEHYDEFLRLIDEPVKGGDRNVMGQLDLMMPQAIQVTPEERDAILRLEAMGFERSLFMEVFFACNKNEELAANYLLDHMNEF